MEQKRNYQRELEKIIESNTKRDNEAGFKNSLEEEGAQAPSLLLHACCAPCSSYCLEYLCKFFRITVFFYNPNISLSEEYTKRVAEEKRLITAYNDEMKNGIREGFEISIIEGGYDPGEFYEAVKGLEKLGEGTERCFKCFELRLRKSAEIATKHFDYFTTTLTISPLKNADILNEIGEQLAQEYGVTWLPSDFKKKNGYKRSTELSKEYDLYRQDYCGCAFSKAERESQKNAEIDKMICKATGS